MVIKNSFWLYKQILFGKPNMKNKFLGLFSKNKYYRKYFTNFLIFSIIYQNNLLENNW